jgi:diguanylate cyclase (GGDEF)-like protein/PAS domain S-box-containing protein
MRRGSPAEIRLLAKLWAKTSLVVRVMFSAGFALAVAGGLLLYVSTGKDARFAREQIREHLDVEMESLLPAISEWVVIGDYATIEQTLRQHVGRPDVGSITWTNSAGQAVDASDKPMEPRAPDWFVRWIDIPAPEDTQSLDIGGRDYGSVTIRMTAIRDRDRLWDAFLGHLGILALAVGLDFLGILLILKGGLRPLTALDRGARAMEDGDLSVRLQPHGSPELVHVITAFNRMAEAVETAQHELRQEAERLSVTLTSIGDGVITTDAAGKVDFVNPTAAVLTGWTTAEAHGLPLPQVFNIVNEHSREPAENPADKVLRLRSGVGVSHSLLITRQGQECPIQDSAAPIRDRHGRIIGVVLVFRDISEQRRLTRQLSYQASHDSLTGLINRGEFERRLARLLDDAADSGQRHALLYVDLDQFKVVNDTCGHRAGDELLRQLAERLQRCMRHADTLARVGGDEFGILLEDCSEAQALRIAAGIIDEVRSFHFAWFDHAFGVSLSIGLVAIDEAHRDLTSVLSAADAACYTAKDKGRNRVQAYTATDGEMVERQRQMQWVTRIAKAFDEARFELYFQPIVPITGVVRGDGEEHHIEVLLRMREGTTLVSPGAFVVAAERYGAIDGIDRWVVANTLHWLVAHAHHRIVCSINLSGHSVNDDRFRDFVMHQVRISGVSPRKVCFEITETAAIASLSKAGDFIKTVRSLGCRFSLDDFGSGMASFSYLRSLPVDYLKIDGSFVRNIVNDPIDRAMVETVNKVGHVMGIQTIAEFVENPEVLATLREIGVDYAQGYVFAKPAPLADVASLFAAPE